MWNGISQKDLFTTNKDETINKDFCIYCYKNGKEVSICQSCGMPLNEENLISTNKNGSKNKKYCIYCYKKKFHTTKYYNGRND